MSVDSLGVLREDLGKAAQPGLVSARPADEVFRSGPSAAEKVMLALVVLYSLFGLLAALLVIAVSGWHRTGSGLLGQGLLIGFSAVLVGVVISASFRVRAGGAVMAAGALLAGFSVLVWDWGATGTRDRILLSLFPVGFPLLAGILLMARRDRTQERARAVSDPGSGKDVADES